MSIPTATWFRMYTEAVDDEKLRLLAFEDRWHFVAILCCKRRGILDSGDSHDLLCRKLCVKLGLQPRELTEVGKRLSDVGLIDCETFQPLAWNDRQFESDVDSTNTDRQRRFRERHKTQVIEKYSNPLRNVTSNDDVTALETETEAEAKSFLPSAGVDASRIDPQQSPDESPETAPTQDDSSAHRGVPRNPCPAERIVDLYHEKLPMCRRVEQLTPNRRASLRARWHNELPTLEAFGNYFDDVAASRFLTGRAGSHGDRKPFVADFDWLLKPSNLVKVLEGKYHDG